MTPIIGWPDSERSAAISSKNPILQACRELTGTILNIGVPFEGTQEVVGSCLRIDVTDCSMEDLITDLKEYYGEEKYERRFKCEQFHYNQIKYGLLHKVEELFFFHKTALENRKIIIFSNDCISSVQYLKRGGEAHLFVHMRSSDVLELLPMDLVFLAEAFKAVHGYYTHAHDGGTHVPFLGMVTSEIMHITIGSAHYYTTGGRL